MLCNVIHNVLHNMLRAKNPPSHFPLPGSRSASLQCLFIQQLLVGLALIIGEGHATFRAGLICGRDGAVGGALRRSAGLDSRCGPVVLGWIFGVLGQHLACNVCRALQASSLTSSSGAQVLRVRALTLRDAATEAFHGRHCHGLRALPTTILREHVVESPDKSDRSKKLQVILPINAVDSEIGHCISRADKKIMQQNGRFSIK